MINLAPYSIDAMSLESIELRVVARTSRRWNVYAIYPAIGRRMEIIHHPTSKRVGISYDGVTRWGGEEMIESALFRDIGCCIFADILDNRYSAKGWGLIQA